jgi:hypothetical protein
MVASGRTWMRTLGADLPYVMVTVTTLGGSITLGKARSFAFNQVNAYIYVLNT